MSFASTLDKLALHKSTVVRRFEQLIAPKSDSELESMAQTSRALTLQHFGRTMRLFAPLYLSNECINNCHYCGFSRDNPILRVTLSVDQIEKEVRYLAQQGFRNILLVSGEHPKYVSNGYLADVVRRVSSLVPAVSLEVGPMETEVYRPLIAAGAEGLVVYQETYNRDIYAELHTSGPKKDFDWRLECPERAYAAGFRRIGIGALLGLAEWRSDAIPLAEHTEFLLRTCWRSQLTVSLPRIRAAAGGFHPRFAFSDRDLVQLLCALRVTFPQIGLVLSTRESAVLRDALMPLGVTLMSAGSRTEPGGYTGQGKESLHLTVKGRIADSISTTNGSNGGLANRAGAKAECQFEVEDHRSPEEIVHALRAHNLEPVWKDWDAALLGL